MPLFLDMLWRETEGDAALRRRAFAGLRRYQEAVRPPLPPQPRAAASAGSARLLHYGTENTAKNGENSRAPAIFIPSLINPPTVLDLSEEQSLLRHLAALGHDPWLVDWGKPDRVDMAMDLGAHIEQRLIPMIASLGRPVIPVGYCLGGTLALGAAQALDVRAVATIAAPWNFEGFSQSARAEVEKLWAGARSVCEKLGFVPMEVLQSGFWALDPARTIHKYAAFGEMELGSDAERAFLALEDWANAGPPLTYATGAELFDRLYTDNLTGADAWEVMGKVVRPSALPCPTLSIKSSSDRIVPAASSPDLSENWTLSLGHVGMIVGGRARASLWDPLSEWLFKQGG